MIVAAEKVIMMAIHIEEVGRDFYKNLMDSIDRTSSFHRILSSLMMDEIKHKKIYERLLSKIRREKQSLIELRKDELEKIMLFVEDKIFDQLKKAENFVKNAGDISQIILYALGFELDTVYFFEKIEDKIIPAEKAVIQTIIKEEKSHVEQLILLKSMIKYENKMQAPKNNNKPDIH